MCFLHAQLMEYLDIYKSFLFSAEGVLTFYLFYIPDQLLISSPKRLCSDCFQTKDTFKQDMQIFQAY